MSGRTGGGDNGSGSRGRRPKKKAASKGRAKRAGARRRGREKGVFSAIRLSLAVVVVTLVAAVGVNLSLMETEDIDSLADPAERWTGERVRVEVLNAGGVTGMAREGMEVLREAGFDVVEFGNAASFDPERPSEVIDRVGRAEIAQAVATAIGIDNVLSDPDPNLFVEVTVVVGRDWVGLEGIGITEPVAGEDAWWDPRTWF